MGLISRFVRLCKADAHGVMDQMEDKGLVLAQCLREMEQELAVRQTAAARLAGARDKAVSRLERSRAELDGLERDCALALEEGRDDIARFLIRRIKPEQAREADLASHVETLSADLEKQSAALAERQREVDALKARAGAYMAREETRQWRDDFTQCPAFREPSDEEVELELLRRRQGAGKEDGR
ncbi:MAG: PspA/IM30 family protein [Desulfatibacillaceae bacterium]